ncbi:DUF1801 domain-containing protein [Lacihabitans sp. LS3-19]|uniref:iron chaperone n=1 Tax=Lacihabitans sp. LS3-19 TaxID=2487335 RepID=UPI0020CBC128|nr:DUF1801 domain-containing protein [Lacihabitans sp. LS3-19]MCP9768237.1 DUF1801 domain-containing protein [Lacihabitans sp. LS3-19]
MNTKFKTVDQYIGTFPEETQKQLEIIRDTIKKAAPDAKEIISYNMPAYKQHGVLVYFAAYQNHIGFYPTSSGINFFSERFSEYKWSKGAVQFPISKPLPLDLISEITKFRLEDDRQRFLQKKKP